MNIVNPLRLRACEKPPKVATALVRAAGPAQLLGQKALNWASFWSPAGSHKHSGVLGDTECSKWPGRELRTGWREAGAATTPPTSTQGSMLFWDFRLS